MDEKAEKATSFTGTGIECVAWLNSYFSTQRKIVEGARMSAEKNGQDLSGFDQMLDTLDRQVHTVTVEPMMKLAKQRVRPEAVGRVTRIETGLELYDLVANA